MNPLRIKFAVCFSRFEYALKATTYRKPISKENHAALADWSKFAGELKSSGVLNGLDAVGKILQDPPRKQIVYDNTLAWAEVGLGTGETRQVIEAIKRLRNNLFHGGKENEAAEEQARSDELLALALEVLEKALDADPKVKDAFWDTFDDKFERDIFEPIRRQ